MYIFEIKPGSKQREHIEAIRQRSKMAWPAPVYSVQIEEDCPFQTIYLTVTVDPEPPYYGDVARHAIFADQAKFAVDWDWAKPSN